MQIHFLHGTETGTAEFLCDDLQASLPEGIVSDIASLADTAPADLAGDALYVLVQSTFGSGDVAGTGYEFHMALQNDRPDLSHVRFAIFGLGDRTFDATFNHGSEKMMTELLACGATMVGERGVADASAPEMPEDIAVPWLEAVLAQV